MTPTRLFWGLIVLLHVGLGGIHSYAEEAAPSWRERFTLGPGDILSLSLYGRPELERGELFVQPDGTLNYLQASVRASGLTMDELRTSLEKELARYYRHPRLIITPLRVRSKRYFILGKVIDKGAFEMDRPLTLLEVVARSRGIETGLFEQNTVELADLPRSFVVRAGKRLAVDFERLFFQGDMSQNVEIEPNDYIYIASATTNDVYVLGDVADPSVQGFTPRLTVMAAVTTRGGFTANAYRERVLVIRGSLNQPERIVVDTDEILRGLKPDFLLQPKDIVYVSNRPWKIAEDLLDTAVGAFIQSATASWTGANIGPGIQKSVLPQIK